MKVLQVVSSHRNTGPGAAALVECRALKASGHDVCLLAVAGGSIERECGRLGIPFRPMPDPRRRGGFLALSRMGASLMDAVAQRPAEVVHVHRTQEQIAAHFVLRRGHPGPALVRSLHRMPFARAPLLSGLALRRADGLIFPCAAFLEPFRASTFGLPMAIAVLPGGVDVAEHRPDRRSGGVRAAHGAADETTPLIGLVSRFKAGRRIELYLDALASMPKDLAWAAVCVGRGEREEELGGRIKALGLERRVRLVNAGDAYPDLIACLDIGVALDPGSDGSSRPVLEMFASGVPVVGSDRGAISDLVLDGKCGIRVADGDRAALAAAIERLSRDGPGRAAMGRAARERACRDFSLEALGRRLSEFYAEAAKSHAE